MSHREIAKQPWQSVSDGIEKLDKKMFVINLADLADDTSLRTDTKFVKFNMFYFRKFKQIVKEPLKLKQITHNIRNGKDIAKKFYSDYETNFCYLTVNNIKPFGEIQLDNITYLKEEKEIEKIAKEIRLEDGDYIITRSGTVGIVNRFSYNNLPEQFKDKTFIPSGYLIVFKVNKTYNNNNFMFYLSTELSREYFQATACGKSQQNLSQDYLKKWIIPIDKISKIPIKTVENHLSRIEELKLKEQIKKAKPIVDEVFSKYFKLDFKQFSDLEKKYIFEKNLFNLSKSTQLRNSLKFHHPKFDFILEKLNDFKTVKLKQLLKEPIFSGVKPEYDRHEGTIPIIKTINIKDGFIDYNTEDYVNLDFINLLSSKKVLSSGDIIITTHGEGRGKIGLLELHDKDFDMVITDANCSVVRLKNNVNKKYVYYYFISEFGKTQLKILEAETKSVRYIPNEEIEKLIVIYPPLQIQNQIIKNIETKLNEQKKITEQIEKLKQEIDNLIKKTVLT